MNRRIKLTTTATEKYQYVIRLEGKWHVLLSNTVQSIVGPAEVRNYFLVDDDKILTIPKRSS